MECSEEVFANIPRIMRLCWVGKRYTTRDTEDTEAERVYKEDKDERYKVFRRGCNDYLKRCKTKH